MDEKDRAIAALAKENAYLKRLLEANRIQYEKPISFDVPMHSFSSSEEKVRLFRDYFKGREDVYASMRLGKDGKKLIYPVCINRLNGRYCPHFGEHGCKGCDKRENAPLTDEAILNHLKGRETIGVYPLHSDDTCYFLAVDFDGEGYRSAANAYRKAAWRNGLSCLVELSQSGNGAHAYLFFASAIKAYKARQLGSYLLEEAMELSSSVGFSSFDRMFPAQDYLPKRDGLGNLILLPLQGEAKTKEGKSAFVDENFLPYPIKDQLSLLASITKIMETEIDLILRRKKAVGSTSYASKILQKPPKLSKNDFPDTLIIEDRGELILSKAGMSLEAATYISRLASLPNPLYYERQRKRMPLFAYGKPIVSRFLVLTKEDETFLYLPRGCKDNLLRFLSLYQVRVLEKGARFKGKGIEASFKGVLRPDQAKALSAMKQKENGMIVAPTSFGKTVLAIAAIADFKVNAFIIVPRLSLLKQWQERLEQFLDIEAIRVGKKMLRFGEYSGSKKKLTYRVDVASIESLGSEKAKQELSRYGLVIIDEAHHLAASSYEAILRSITSRYLYAFTATKRRSDGLHSLFPPLLGDILYEKESDGEKNVLRRLYPRFTKFSLSSLEKNMGYSDILSALICDKERNELITKDLEEAYGKGGHILLLSERIEQLEIIRNSLNVPTKDIYLLTGGSEKQEKERVLEGISKGNPYILLSTGRYIGEGFDEPSLDTLFIASPFKWRGLLCQYVGRLHRKKEGKSVVGVYDYIDIKAYLFARMYQERLRGYKKEGYILEGEETLVKRLYSHSEYADALSEDLANAKKEVDFFFSFYEASSLSRLAEMISARINAYSSLDIVCFDEKIKGHKLDNPPANMVIIDLSILYFGDINPFVANQKETGSIMRIEDSSLCAELHKEAKGR